MSLIAIGTLSIPAGAPWYATVIIEAAGVVGLSLKEFLGSAAIPITASQSVSTSAGTTNTASSSGPANLPSLPAGFSLSAAKSAGFTVYEDTKGEVILLKGGVYSDVYGNPLGISSLPQGTTWTLL